MSEVLYIDIDKIIDEHDDGEYKSQERKLTPKTDKFIAGLTRTRSPVRISALSAFRKKYDVVQYYFYILLRDRYEEKLIVLIMRWLGESHIIGSCAMNDDNKKESTVIFPGKYKLNSIIGIEISKIMDSLGFYVETGVVVKETIRITYIPPCFRLLME